jgi:hypothetical protein
MVPHGPRSVIAFANDFGISGTVVDGKRYELYSDGTFAEVEK